MVISGAARNIENIGTADGYLSLAIRLRRLISFTLPLVWDDMIYFRGPRDSQGREGFLEDIVQTQTNFVHFTRGTLYPKVIPPGGRTDPLDPPSISLAIPGRAAGPLMDNFWDQYDQNIDFFGNVYIYQVEVWVYETDQTGLLVKRHQDNDDSLIYHAYNLKING